MAECVSRYDVKNMVFEGEDLVVDGERFEKVKEFHVRENLLLVYYEFPLGVLMKEVKKVQRT